ncbi:MAG: RICIN domain-containing protein, partial [Clostridia bacterium]|nr:RICIN domain-containing protein [Clostridia bacterium]
MTLISKSFKCFVFVLLVSVFLLHTYSVKSQAGGVVSKDSGFGDNTSLQDSIATTRSASANTFFIRNKATGMYLTMGLNASLSLQYYTGGDNQKWMVIDNPNYTVSLINLSQTTPGIGVDCYAVQALSSTMVGVSVRADSSGSLYQYEQGFFKAMSSGYVTFQNRNYFSYLSAMELLQTAVVLSTTQSDYTKWYMISCGNPYILPSISDGSFVPGKYNTTGSDGLRYRMNCYAYAIGIYADDVLDNSTFYERLQPGYLS